jgi:hypothetical protein
MQTIWNFAQAAAGMLAAVAVATAAPFVFGLLFALLGVQV